MSQADNLPLEEDPRRVRLKRHDVRNRDKWFGAVLTADEIEYYCTEVERKQRMIHPYCRRQLRPASYTLRLGNELHLGGKHRVIGSGGVIVLPPHQVAVVSTMETLTIPRFIAARWGIQVEYIYEGLLWTGGMQVDPGWSGRLYCPVYNLAERYVRLDEGTDFFSIDFLRTTALSDEYHSLTKKDDAKKTWFTPKRRTLAEHDKHRLHSAPYEALSEVEEVRQFRVVAQAMIAILFAAIAAVATATTFVGVQDVVNPGEPPVDAWFIGVGGLAAASGILSMAAVFLTWRVYRTLSRFERRR